MLQRLASYSYDDELYGDGTWSREELERMNQEFVAAVETAFQRGLESRAAARATVWVAKPSRQVEEVIEAAWNFLWENDGDLPFVEIVSFVRARCPNVTAAVVRAGFEKRFARGGPQSFHQPLNRVGASSV